MTEFAVRDKIRLYADGEVTWFNDHYVRLRGDDGQEREYSRLPAYALRVAVIQKAHIDGGVYIDDSQDVWKHTATGGRNGSPGWIGWNVYQDAWDSEVSASDAPCGTVHFLGMGEK